MGSSPQRPRILLLRKLVSFSGCSAATHMRSSSSNLTGMVSSVWQEETDNVLDSLRNDSVKSKQQILCNFFLFFPPPNSQRSLSSSVHIPGQTSTRLCCELPCVEGWLWFGILYSTCLLQRSGFRLFPAPNHRDAMFTLTALLLC